MPKYCAAYNCNNNSTNLVVEGKRISFHKFPLKNVDLLNTWLIKLRRENFKPTEHSRLCSIHFEEDCFKYQNFTGVRSLKEDAVPTKILISNEDVAKRKRTSYTFADDSQHESVNEEPEPEINTVESRKEGPDLVLLAMISDLNAENSRLKLALAISQHSVDNVKDEKTMKMLTGFTKVQYNLIFDFLTLNQEIDNAKQLFFMFIIRLRHGVSENFLGYMFGMSQTRISVHLNSLIDIIYFKIKDINIWPSKEKVKRHMSVIFKRHFPNCRVIIDSTEFKLQKPSSPAEQQVTFSYYKNSNTVKCMIGISPSGAISFISDLYGGSISDKELFKRSSLMKLLDSGDAILADRGFLVEKELKTIGCTLHMPLFLKDKIQFNLIERRENKKVSRHRVHVERAIWSIKKFRLFEGAMPIKLLHSIQKLVYITAFLTNFGNPLIKY